MSTNENQRNAKCVSQCTPRELFFPFFYYYDYYYKVKNPITYCLVLQLEKRLDWPIQKPQIIHHIPRRLSRSKKGLSSSYHLWTSFEICVPSLWNIQLSINFLFDGNRRLTNEPLLVCCPPLTLDPIQSLPSNNISQALVCSILPVMLDPVCSYRPICDGTISSCGSRRCLWWIHFLVPPSV